MAKQLKSRWIGDTRLAAAVVLQHDIEVVERNIRNLNDEIADQTSKLKKLRGELRKLKS